ncbi:MAG: FAD-dependent oxidoreductase [Pseudomonadota bacterium]
MDERIVVVGAGQAGQSLVETLRKKAHSGPITLIGDEPVAPYQRPPLSKKYLLGEMSAERLQFRPASYYAEHGIETRFGESVTAIERDAKAVVLGSGECVPYDLLALTTGSRPRLLPDAIGGGLAGVYPVRTLADVDAMAPEVAEGRRVLIVGGGYIGLEGAAVAAQRGMRVTLVEMAPRILARVAAAETAAFFSALHRAHGVDIVTGTGLERLEGEDGRVVRAVLSDGRVLAVDLVLVGIGILPNTELAAAAGLAIDNGIAVDAEGRSSDPAIFAAGDCASFPYQGRRLRLESVQNAIEQAEVAAKAMQGQPQSYAPVPWFWSDQYNVKLQIAGLSQGFDRTLVRPGRGERSQSVWYLRDGRLIAVDAMNDPRAYMSGKRWLEAGVSPDLSQLADPEVELKTISAT